MFLIIIERLWTSSHKVCAFCADTMKTCAAASEHIFYISANVWLLLGVFQCFLRNGWLLLNDSNVRLLLQENVQLIFFVCVAASRNISMFFNECATASKKILTTASEIYLLKEKITNCFLEIMPT